MTTQQQDESGASTLEFKEASAPESSKEASVDGQNAPVKDSPPKFKPGPRFWVILVVLSLVSLLTALEGTVTSTILPSIVADLKGGEDYVWIANATFLSMTALLPLFGQLANVFGRKWPLVFSTAAFMLGSGLSGGASSIAMMIGGRTIQGIGASGIGVLGEIIICDLVPLRDRGTYMGIVFGMVGMGAALGPLFGGLLVSYSTWRWAFYMALPIGGVALVLILLFLNVKYDKSKTMATKLSSIDWLGNVLFIGGVSPVLVALSWAGSVHPWSSYQVLVPLLVGLAALGVFVWIEGNPRLVPNPMMPNYLFKQFLTLIVFVLTFLHGVVTLWATYFMPVYFQGVLGESAYRSGIMLLPTIFAMLPGVGLGGGLLTKFGRYKPILMGSFAIIAVGFGLFSMLDENSSTGKWVGFQIVESFGAGFGMACLLPALLAPLKDEDTAVATSTWAFFRTFGIMWGIAIAGTVYTNRSAQLAAQGAIPSDPAVAAQFMAGGAYASAQAAFLDSLSAQTRAEVISVQSRALMRSWQVAIAFGGVGLVAAAFMKEVPLRKENTTEFGIQEKVDKPTEEEAKATTEKEVPVQDVPAAAS